MVNNKTISEILENTNTGVEYEIALFRCLLKDELERNQVDEAIKKRSDAYDIEMIVQRTSISAIYKELSKRSLTFVDVSFETQNDDIGPADVVMVVRPPDGNIEKLGISVKYANTCTLNVTGRRFLTEAQIVELKGKLPQYTEDYLSEMKQTYGDVRNWFHKKRQSFVTDRYINLIRESVIANWLKKSVDEKKAILMEAYQETSPIQYWVYTYYKTSYNLDTNPYKIAPTDVPLVELRKHESSYVGFFLRGRLIGKMQVKFNNGIVERCKKIHADKIVDGVRMSYGQPFSSWNFSLVN